MKKKQKKTITLGIDQDNPTISMVWGHVTVAEFNRAFRNEGWSGGGRLRKADISRQYVVKTKRGYAFGTEKVKGSKAVTTTDW